LEMGEDFHESSEPMGVRGSGRLSWRWGRFIASTLAARNKSAGSSSLEIKGRSIRRLGAAESL
jgi:hypothetical protein